MAVPAAVPGGAGRLYLYWSAEWLFIVVGLVTLQAGVVAFLLWSWQTDQWPFAAQE